MQIIPRKLTFLLFGVAIVFFILGAESSADHNSFPASENGTCYKRVRYDDEVAANISRGIVKIMPDSQQVGVKTGGRSSQGWVTVAECCEGYTRKGTADKCEAHCSEGCFGGTCTGPDVCTCEEGWRPEAGACKPVCRRPCAANAYCFAPDVCTCKFGYEDIGGVCRPVCLHDCENGDCVAPRDCRCHPGYTLNATKHCEPVCEGGCSHGRCTAPGVCSCHYGYVNPPHDLEYCEPECPESCKNGECYRPGVCTCNPGYIQDTTGSCVPRCQDGCPNGVCVAPEQCGCNPGFVLNPNTRECVESDRGSNSGVGEYSYATTESRRPQVHSQISSPTDRPSAQNMYTTARGTQGVIQNRNQPSREQENTNEPNYQYDVHGSRPTQSPSGQSGIKSRGQGHTQMTVGPDGEIDSNQYRSSTQPSQSQDTHDADTFYYVAEDDSIQQTQRPPASQGSYTPENSRASFERNPTGGSSTTDNYNDYRHYQTQRPPQHRSHPTQNPDNENEWNQTQEPTTTDNYHGYRNNPTQRNQNRRPSTSQEPQGPYNLQGSNNVQNLNNTDDSDDYRTSQTRRPPSSQGPFPTQTPYESHRRNQMQEFSTTENYEHYRNSQTSRPSNQQGPFPSQEYAGQGTGPTRQPYDSNDRYGYHRPSQSQNPAKFNNQDVNQTQENYDHYRNSQTPRPSNQQGPFPSQGRTAQGPGSTQRPYDSNDPYGYHRPSQSQNPAEFNSHGINQVQPHRIQSDSYTYRPQTPDTPQGPFPIPDSYVSPNPYETQGVKTAHRRPNIGQSYGRPATYPSNIDPGVNQPLGSVVHGVPEYNRPIIENPGSNQFYGIYLTYDPSYTENDGTITVLNPSPSFIEPTEMAHPFSQAVCSFPCVNGQCVGPNQCVCKQGYIPDPRSLIGNICLPVCLSGCINGVCSGPNLCICNPGFVKEQGAKGSHRCIPAY